MSSNIRGVNRGFKVISSSKAFIKDAKGNYKLNTKKYDFYGKVDRKFSGVVLKAVNPGVKNKFKEDLINISDSTKNDLASHFIDNNSKKSVAYLVKEKK